MKEPLILGLTYCQDKEFALLPPSNLGLGGGVGLIFRWCSQNFLTAGNKIMKDVIAKTQKYVFDEMSKNDASHDHFHIERVCSLALEIARREGITDEVMLEIIHLGALLHDIKDFKYSGDELSSANTTREWLSNLGYPQDRIERVVFIVQNVSYKDELCTSDSNGISKQKKTTPIELAIVQDADRLDAIGAVGIARCMCFAGATKTRIYDPSMSVRENMTKEEYKNLKGQTAINHFYEKLFKLKDLMKTNAGKQMAIPRHEFMVSFVSQFLSEQKV